MHIGLAIQHFQAGVGGAEAFAVMVMRMLVDRGHRISVVAADGQGIDGVAFHQGSWCDAPACLAALSPDVVVDWGLNIPADLHRLGGGVHSEYQRLTLAARPLLPRLLKKFGYTFSMKHRRTLAAEEALLRDPNAHFLAVSEFVSRQLHAAAEVDDSRVTVLINGVDPARFALAAHAEKRAEIRRRHQIPNDHVVCLLVAHNLWLKNLALLERIFPELVTAEPRLHLMLLGKRNPRIQAPWFTYLGSSRCPEHYYAAADLLVHPTRYDACANVVLEAMASGKTVISSDRNGSAEIIQPGETGIVLPVVGSDQSIRQQWAANILALAQDEKRRVRMGHKAREFILENQTVEKYVDRLEELLAALL